MPVAEGLKPAGASSIRPMMEDAYDIDRDHRADIAELIARWSEATQLYIDGDLRGYDAIARHAEDYTLLPPNGGEARSGFDGSDDAVEWTARTFRDGQFDLDVVKTYTSGDLAVLVAVERQSGAFGDLP
jgi:ketosteroid isomerase-like protein